MDKKNSSQNSKEQAFVLTVDELSRCLKISKSTAYQIVKTENFPLMKCGKRILIPIEPLREWVNSNPSL